MLRLRPVCLPLICLVLAATVAWAAPKDMTVYGKAPVGAFGISTLEHIEGAAKLGMTLIYSYSSSYARKQLDAATPEGQAVLKHRMQVMYPLCGRFTQVRLARDLSATDTTIALKSEKPESIKTFPETGYVVIEGERIEYTGRTDDSFTGCTRGAGGTVAARHPAGLLLCDSEGLRKDILAVKDYPCLWGYWLVDDNRPQEIDSLREMSRIIRATDRDAQGRPNSHIIVMGIGGASAMANYDAGICDALGVYPYPYHKGALNPTTRRQMRFIMARARSLEPEIGLIGIYQAFAFGASANWKEMPTPEQVREDMLSFYDWGADGVLAFIYHWEGPNKEPQGLDAVPAVCEMIKQTNEDILAGKIKRVVPETKKMEWFSVLTGEAAKVTPGGEPAYDLDDPAKLAALAKGRPDRLSVEPFTAEGRSYPLKVSFPAWDKADPKSDRWPIAQIEGTALTTSDWSGMRYLEQPIYNPGATTIALRVSLEDNVKGWWERAGVEIPPQTAVLLRIPMEEARLSMDPSHVKRWLLWEADPSTAVTFRLGTPRLVPAQP
ncbi:MAG: hypothetical protein ACYC63_00135 [Armatimonadota bacterium]